MPLIARQSAYEMYVARKALALLPEYDQRIEAMKGRLFEWRKPGYQLNSGLEHLKQTKKRGSPSLMRWSNVLASSSPPTA